LPFTVAVPGLLAATLAAVSLPSSAQIAPPPHYTFAGLNAATSGLKALFPASSAYGERHTERVFVSDQDVRDGVYFVSVRAAPDSPREVRLSFEMPDRLFRGRNLSWREQHVLRHPACDAIESRLIATYGNPKDIERFEEEALSFRSRVWTRAGESMTLQCYQIDGKGPELASSIRFVR